jgi:hypothetical protein
MRRTHLLMLAPLQQLCVPHARCLCSVIILTTGHDGCAVQAPVEAAHAPVTLAPGDGSFTCLTAAAAATAAATAAAALFATVAVPHRT